MNRRVFAIRVYEDTPEIVEEIAGLEVVEPVEQEVASLREFLDRVGGDVLHERGDAKTFNKRLGSSMD